jgi:hypothetical protein
VSNPWSADLVPFGRLDGKTIKTFEVTTALWGTTPTALGFMTFTDGTRTCFLLEKGHVPWKQMVRLADSEIMRAAPHFFTDDEVAQAVSYEMAVTRQAKENERQRKLREIERLQKELG